MSAPHQLSLLLAEDTPANQKVIGTILRKRGHRVTVTANGREALECATTSKYDAILMDLQMPIMDGYEAAAAIREHEQASGAHTPIIALTAHSPDHDRDAHRLASMDAYLAKPIDIGELVEVVESTAARQPVVPTEATRTRLNTDVDSAADGVSIDLQATRKRLGGDEELLEEFIEVFQEDSPKLLQNLQSAIGRGDCPAAARAAHSLKALAANFGASSVVEMASLLEVAGNRNDLSQTDSVFARLCSALPQLSALLEQYRRA